MAQGNEGRVREWVAFRRQHLVSQASLASMLGVSRRTVQYMEDPRCDAQPWRETLNKFKLLRQRMKPVKKAKGL